MGVSVEGRKAAKSLLNIKYDVARTAEETTTVRIEFEIRWRIQWLQDDE